jgi:hypothetical protein
VPFSPIGVLEYLEPAEILLPSELILSYNATEVPKPNTPFLLNKFNFNYRISAVNCVVLSDKSCKTAKALHLALVWRGATVWNNFPHFSQNNIEPFYFL